MKKNSAYISIFMLFVSIALTACGGGDGNDPLPPVAQNVAPVANAGADITVESGTQVTLSGSASTDSDGSITGYSWYEETSVITFTDPSSVTQSFTPVVTTDTTYIFSLTVEDNEGQTSVDKVTVTVTAPAELSSTKDSSWTIESRVLNFEKVVFTGTKYLAAGSAYLGESTDGINWTEIDTGYSMRFADLAVNGNGALAIQDPRYSLIQNAAITADGSSWQVVNNTSTECTSLQSVSQDGSQYIGLFRSSAICTSVDGINWQLKPSQSIAISKIVYGASKYALVLRDGGLMILGSLDSTASSVPALPGSSTATFSDLIYGGSAFVGIRAGEIIYSSDAGVNWSAVSGTDIPAKIKSISYSSSKGFVAISNDTDPVIFSSNDGATWSMLATSNLPQSICTYCSIVNGATETLLISNRTAFYKSTDLIAWTLVTPIPPEKMRFVLTFNNLLYGINSVGALVSSSNNGANWTVVSDSSIGGITSLIHDGSRFIARAPSSGQTPGIFYSSDGVSWTESTSFGGSYVFGTSVKVGTTTYSFTKSGVYNGDKNKIFFSDDGISYQVDNSLTAVTPSTAVGIIKQAATDGSIIVAIPGVGIYSNSAGDWANVVSVGNLQDIVWTGTSFVAVGQSGRVMTSPDSVTWTTQTWLNSTSTITDILVVGSKLYATDSLGNIATSDNDGVLWTLSKDFRAATSVTGNTITELAYDGTTVYGFGFNSGSFNVTTVKTTDSGVNWDVRTSTGTVVSGHVIYDTVGSRFVSTSKQVLTTDATTGAETWEGVATQLPDVPSFAYISTQEALAGMSLGRLYYDSSANTYISGNAGYSVDGQNWVIKTGLVAYHFLDYAPASGIFARLNASRIVQTSTDGINYTDVAVTGMASQNLQFNYIKYVNDQYIGVNNHATTGIPGIYTSANATDWTLIAETSLGLGAYDENGRYARISDMEYDGTRYLFLFAEGYSSTKPGKGMMIAFSTDLQNFTLRETGVRVPAGDLVIESNGYKMQGTNIVVTHAFY